MATAARTSFLRSVASGRVARAPPPLHRLLVLRRHGGRPDQLSAGGLRIPSTPSPPAPPPTNKGLLNAPPPLNELGWHTITRATISASPFLVFGGIMYGWVKPVQEEFRESFATASRERAEMKDNIIRSIADDFQKIRDLLENHDFMERR